MLLSSLIFLTRDKKVNMAVAGPNPTLYATIRTLPDGASLYDKDRGGYFLTFSQSEGWKTGHQPIPNAGQKNHYSLIVRELCENGLGDFPNQEERERVISAVNQFFTSIPPHHQLQTGEGSLAFERDSGPFSFFHLNAPSLLVDDEGEVFPTMRTYYDKLRLEYAHSEHPLDKLAPSFKTQGQVDRIVNDYLAEHPENQDDDHRMIDLAQRAIRLGVRQNPALQAALLSTEDRALIYRVPSHRGPFQLCEFAGPPEATRGSLLGQDPEGLGRNWLGHTLQEIRRDLARPQADG